MSRAGIQYISDEKGNFTSIIVPVEFWRKIESERETVYVLKSEIMKQRLLKAKIPLTKMERKHQLSAAAKLLFSDYSGNGDLTAFTALDQEDFYA